MVSDKSKLNLVGPRPCSKRVTVTQLLFSQTLRMLLQGDGLTVAEMIEETGMNVGTVRDWLNAMLRERVIYICGWVRDRNGRLNTAMYAMGLDQPNAKRRTMSKPEQCRRYRERKRIKRYAQPLTQLARNPEREAQEA